MEQNTNGHKILVGITGRSADELIEKLKDIDSQHISEAGLFLEMIEKDQRKILYDNLDKYTINSFPLVHIRNDMDLDEIKMLSQKYNSEYLTIHEDSFNVLDKWSGFEKKLYLEMNTDNIVDANVDVSKIGGFCIDISHYMVESVKRSKEFDYINKLKENSSYFACNHINGYNFAKNVDMHNVTSIEDFDYLKDIPQFLYGKVIAFESFNPIAEQLKYIGYIKDKFGI